MSFRLPPPSQQLEGERDPEDITSSSEDETDPEGETWDDWVSDSNTRQDCRSLFEDKIFQSVNEALQYDAKVYKFNLNAVCEKLALDFYGRVRLINYIRKNKPGSDVVSGFNGREPWFADDEYLVPVIENDPLIQTTSDDWSDSDDEGAEGTDPQHDIKRLRKQLALAQQTLFDYRALMAEKLGLTDDVKDVSTPLGSQPSRDDDSHYFESYGSNDIHAIMIQDKVRTSTYAHFIMKNPILFRDAVVLDVGCGTGILSLFAAKAGAKRVFAVDASNIVEKAAKVVKANNLEDTITVIRGKIEDISLPEDIKVDIIISEWMGYALLYESMLDSVLHARDRFLRPGGVLAPSQCKMMLGLCDGSEIYKDRIGFWDDVYGFDLSIMAEDLYEEAIIDIVGPRALISKPSVVKDLILGDITIRQLDFSTPFNLVSTSDRRTKVNAFVLYFDTFFTATGEPVPAGTNVNIIKEGDVSLVELWPVGGKPAHKRRQSMGPDKGALASFSTGPLSTPTHWKQTIFMLREPITVSDGTLVNGSFHCRKSQTNSRELDVEIHYSVVESEGSPPSETIVQVYKIR